MRVIRLSDLRRRRQRSASDLDSALERALEVRVLRGDFESELRAADALASAFGPVSPPAEALVALRAAIAARKATASRRRARRLVLQTAPGAVAAAAIGLLVFVGIGGGEHQQQLPVNHDYENANATIQLITERMAQVRNVVAARDPAAAAASAQEARDVLIQAQNLAATLPADESSVKDLLLQTAEVKIAELEALLARVNLAVPPLPPVKSSSSPSAGAQQQASGPSSSATSSTEAPSSTTSSTSSSTTSTTQGGGGGVLAAASNTGKKASDSTSSSSSSSTSSSTSTTNGPSSTTTTAPPPPSTTSTTAPPP